LYKASVPILYYKYITKHELLHKLLPGHQIRH